MNLSGDFGGYLLVVFLFTAYMCLVGYSRLERALIKHENGECSLLNQFVTIPASITFQLTLATLSTIYTGLLLSLSDSMLAAALEDCVNNPEDYE